METALALLTGFIIGVFTIRIKDEEVFEKLPRKGKRICEPYKGEFIKYTLSRTVFYCSVDAKKGDWILLKNKTVQYMGKTEIFN